MTRAAAQSGWRGAVERRLGLRHRRDWLLLILLVIGGGYFAYAMLYEGWNYVALKSSAKAAPAQLRDARWSDPALACPGDTPVGAQLDRLFERGYEGFVTQMLWDRLPPRYELIVSGMAAPKRGFELRHLQMSVELSAGGSVVLRDAVIGGESGQLENAKLWLIAACTK